MRGTAGPIPLLILLFGVVSLLLLSLISTEHIVVGQSSSDGALLDKWSASYSVQYSIVSRQSFISTEAVTLQNTISLREAYLSNLLTTATSNPTSSNGGESFTSECVIATAAFGSNLAPQVQFLRDFRDNEIKSTVAGSSFMQAFNLWYYSFSPSVAEYERGQPWLQQLVRTTIIPLLAILQLSETGYSLLDGESGALLAGFVASGLIGMVYFGPIAYVALSRKSIFMTRIILYSLILAGGGAAMISIGVFFENVSGILMLATAIFVLGILAASATFMAKLSHNVLIVSKNRGWISTPSLKRRSILGYFLVPSILLILAILCSAAAFVSAFASAPSFEPQQSLSKEDIENQLRRLAEMKTWLQETQRAESLFAAHGESRELTARVVELIAQYVQYGSTTTDQSFHEGMQFASDSYQKLSDRVSGADVAERHGLLRQTLSNAILQLSFSSGDYVSFRTCQTCTVQQADEFYNASLFEVETSTQNFNTVYSMLADDETQIKNFNIEIENMPDN